MDWRLAVKGYDIIEIELPRKMRLNVFVNSKEYVANRCIATRERFNLTIECLGDSEVISGSFSHLTICVHEKNHVDEEKAVLQFNDCFRNAAVERLEFYGICEGHQNISRTLCFVANSTQRLRLHLKNSMISLVYIVIKLF